MDSIRRQLQILDEQLRPDAGLRGLLLYRSCMAVPAIGLILGIIVQEVWGLSFSILTVYLSTVLLIFAAAGLRYGLRPGGCAVAVLLVCTGLGAVRLAVHEAPGPADVRRLVTEERRLATLRGRVCSDVRRADRDSWQFGRYSWAGGGSSFYMDVRQVQTPGGWAVASGRVRVQADGEVTAIGPGDSVQVYCWLSRISEPLNPGQFDLQSYLRQQGVHVAATVPSSLGIIPVDSVGTGWLSRARFRLRDWFAGALLDAGLADEQSAAVIEALILGRRDGLSDRVNAAFRRTGLAHFICLSGMHMGILAMFVWRVGRAAGLLRRPRALVCLVVITLYVLMVPPRPATLRAAFLCWFFCTAILVRRRPEPLNTLALSGFVLLLFRPMDLFSPGWQLSYLSVLGILLLEPRIRHALERLLARGGSEGVHEAVWTPGAIVRGVWERAVALLAVGLAAWLGSAGVLLYHFGTVNPLSSLWTVLTFPLVLGIVVLGFVKVLVSVWLPTLAALLGVVTSGLASVLIRAVGALSQLGPSQVLIGQVAVAAVLAYYGWLMIARFQPWRMWRARTFVHAGFCAAVVVPLGWAKYSRTHAQDLTVTVLSVGHGQAVHLALPDGRHLLFDCGSLTMSDCGRRVVLPYLQRQGVARLDAAIVSHDDIDHLNGLPEVAEGVSMKRVCGNPMVLAAAQTLSSAGFLRQSLERQGIVMEGLEDIAAEGGGATLRWLWPDEPTLVAPAAGDNDKSQVLLIEYAGRRILLCSDIEEYGQRGVLDGHRDLHADVVIMPHHGSTRNLMEGFAERLNVRHAVINCSRSRVESAWVPASDEIQTWYTPVHGAVTVRVNRRGDLDVDSYCSLDSYAEATQGISGAD